MEEWSAFSTKEVKSAVPEKREQYFLKLDSENHVESKVISKRLLRVERRKTFIGENKWKKRNR